MFFCGLAVDSETPRKRIETTKFKIENFASHREIFELVSNSFIVLVTKNIADNEKKVTNPKNLFKRKVMRNSTSFLCNYLEV
jgi:hypothetical protein